MKTIRKIALFFILVFFLCVSGCGDDTPLGNNNNNNNNNGNNGNNGGGVDVIWEWKNENGWDWTTPTNQISTPPVYLFEKFGSDLKGLSTGGTAPRRMNGRIVYARSRPVVWYEEAGGIFLGGRGTTPIETITRLLVGGAYSAETVPWTEGGANKYHDDDQWEETMFDLSTRPIRITVTIPKYEVHGNRSLLIIRINNNTTSNANGPLGANSPIRELRGPNFTSGSPDVVTNLPTNEKGERVWTVEFHPDRIPNTNPGKGTLAKSYLSFQAQAGEAGTNDDNFVVISSIKVEYDDSITWTPPAPPTP
jgi:hypothetical protein